MIVLTKQGLDIISGFFFFKINCYLYPQCTSQFKNKKSNRFIEEGKIRKFFIETKKSPEEFPGQYWVIFKQIMTCRN